MPELDHAHSTHATICAGATLYHARDGSAIATRGSERPLADPGASLPIARRIELTNPVRSIDMSLGTACDGKLGGIPCLVAEARAWSGVHLIASPRLRAPIDAVAPIPDLGASVL